MKRNIYIGQNGQPIPYTTPRSYLIRPNYPKRKRKTHAQYLEEQLDFAWKLVDEKKDAVSAVSKDGVYLEIRGATGYEMVTKSLEHLGQRVRLMNIKTEANKDGDETIVSTVFIPNDQRDFFQKRLDKYKESNRGQDVITTIENINLAIVDALWTGNRKDMPSDEKVWCEVWLLTSKSENPNDVLLKFQEVCRNRHLEFKEKSISKNETNVTAQALFFPERIVTTVLANKSDLAYLQENISYISEYRKMASVTGFILSSNEADQREWAEDIKNRIDISERSNTSISILDSGVNNGHPLIEDFLDDIDLQSVLADQHGINDNYGHGTLMAGIAIYNNLEELIRDNVPLKINHILESVKIYENGYRNDPEFYGYLTQQAVNLLEINQPNTNRLICMAVTVEHQEEDDGRPSSYSGAVDSLISGVEEFTKSREPRLMFISAGNTTVGEIYTSQDHRVAQTNHSVENPAQAWNAITVGAYTDKDNIPQEYQDNYSLVVNPKDISPFSSTSLTWSSLWPIKPDIVFEGGNLAYENNSETETFYTEFDELKALSTSKDFLTGNSFEPFSMTSLATAQAANFGATLVHHYPEYWPETIRGLIIHSANWTEEMKKNILPDRNVTKADYRNLVRTCGYGVPNLQNAITSASNRVNLIVEDELQPYIKENNSVKTNDMNLHTIPWPSDLLLSMGDIPIKMRVTLSYYIDPAPGEVGWKDKYRYQSCGLRFDVKNTNESKEEFLERTNKAIRDAEYENPRSDNSSRWLLGSNTRDAGSIHSDIWEGTAIELSSSNEVAVYPVQGWWKTRPHLQKYNSRIRYSLIVSLETPSVENDLYAEITNQIDVSLQATNELEIEL